MRNIHTMHQYNILSKFIKLLSGGFTNMVSYFSSLICFSAYFILKSIKQLYSVLFLFKKDISKYVFEKSLVRVAMIGLCLIGLNTLSAQITFDAASSGLMSNARFGNVSHTTAAGSNRILLVSVSAQQPTHLISTVTYNNIPLARLGTSYYNVSGTRLELWYLIAPPVGTYNVVVDAGAAFTENAVVGVQTFTGVHQTAAFGTPIGTSGTSTTASVTVTASAGDLTYGIVTFNNGDTDLSPGASQTELLDGTVNTSVAGGVSTKGGTGLVTLTWTSTLSNWTIGAVPLKAAPSASANPGGVPGVSLWLKANTGTSTSTDGVAVSSWSDMSGYTNNVSQVTGSKQPIFRNNTTHNINFNPVVDLDGTDDEMTDASGIMGTSTFTNASVFAVTRTDAVKDHTLIEETVLGGSHFLLHNPWMDNSIHWDGANSNRISAAWSYTTGEPYLFTGHNNIALTNKKVLRVNGSTVNSSTSALNTFQGNNRPLALGNEASGLKYYDGKIGEVMLYLIGLTDLERSQVESYLAIKYGFTLDQTTPQNYIASDGTTVYWDATTNATYKNNIAGIARDDASGLTQKQSKSVNSGLQVVIGNGNTIAVSNAANSSTFSVDKSALVWGDNGASVSSWTTTGAPANRQILSRVWRVAETGFMPANKIQIADNSGTNGLPAEATLVYLLVDNDGDFTSGATSIPMTLNGTNWEATADFLDDNYFTFATQIPTAPGGGI